MYYTVTKKSLTEIPTHTHTKKIVPLGVQKLIGAVPGYLCTFFFYHKKVTYFYSKVYTFWCKKGAQMSFKGMPQQSNVLYTLNCSCTLNCAR